MITGTFIALLLTSTWVGLTNQKRNVVVSPKEFFDDRHQVLTTATDDDSAFEMAKLQRFRHHRKKKLQKSKQQISTLKEQFDILRVGKSASMAKASDIDYGPNVTRVINEIINNKGYDKRIRPNYKGQPVTVGLSLFVSGVSSVSEVNMDVTLDFYFRQFWQDPRLGFDGMWDEELAIGGEFMKEIWRPDTFFVNVRFLSLV